MLISHKKKFIFVHIYKTAGTSVTSLLVPHARLVDRLVWLYLPTRKMVSLIIRLMNWYDDGQKQFTGVHKHAPAIDILNYLGAKRYHDYFKFIFIRNPFDLVVSLYFYIKQSPNHINHNQVIQMTFGDFVKWHLNKNPPLQVDFLRHPESKEVIVDYIGRFETLNNDLVQIQRILKIEEPIGAQHLNPSAKRKKKDYRSYYDVESRKMVSTYFKEDLVLLGYEFDGVNENKESLVISKSTKS